MTARLQDGAGGRVAMPGRAAGRLQRTSECAGLGLHTLLAVCLGVIVSALLPAAVHAQFFPIYDETTSNTSDETHETWVIYPFYSQEATSSTLVSAVHPFYSHFSNSETGEWGTDVVWPIYTYRYKPQTIGGAEDFSRHYLFPIYYDRTESRFGAENHDRFILPIWYDGRQGKTGRYQILFPIYWYAYNAELAVPLFPPRRQTFAAIFPIAGDFRGYWNRDRIAFFLWPIFVYSNEGQGEDRNEIYSLVWPVFSLYKGEKMSGFRVWPLYAQVEKEGEYERRYWLWPLGHHRKGRISRTNAEEEDVTMFLPFYADFKRPGLSLEMVFPFYGELVVKDRTSRGYFLAIYNTDTNTRRGTRETRYLWFLIRKKTVLPGYPPEEVDPKATLGGGFFPFYVRTYNDTRVSKSIAWPIHHYRQNIYDDHVYTRSYIIPFYVNKEKQFTNGDMMRAQALFPFFRKRQSLAGVTQTNSLHLFYYTSGRPMDRNLAPLWTFWEKKENRENGETTVRVMKNLSKYEKAVDGVVHRRANFLFLDYQSTTTPEGMEVGHTRLFFGLVGRHKEPGLKTEVLGFKF